MSVFQGAEYIGPTSYEIIDLNAMSKAQLLEYASAHGVEVPTRATKAQIIAAIRG